jgi:hypothetical protein
MSEQGSGGHADTVDVVRDIEYARPTAARSRWTSTVPPAPRRR